MKNKLKVLLISIISLIIIWFIPLPDIIAFKIGLNNTVKDEAVSIAGIKPIQYKRFEILKKVTSTRKLKKLFKNHPSRAVKCYSFWALLDRNEEVNLFELLESELSDERKVSTMFGCIISQTTVTDFLIQMSREYLNVIENETLDSLIIYSDNNLSSREYLLSTINPTKDYYDRIKELVLGKSSQTAIIALAKFRNENDINLLLNELRDTLKEKYYTLLSIKNFPHNIFIDDLLDIQHKMLLKVTGIDHIAIRSLYKALVRYDNILIAERLEGLINIANELELLKKLPDSIKVVTKFESEYFNIEIDSSLYILEHNFSKSNEYTIQTHLKALKLALLDFPNSKYNYLYERINLQDWEMDMIKQELEFSKFE